MTPLDQTAQLAARTAHLAHPPNQPVPPGRSLPFHVPPTRVGTGARPRRTPLAGVEEGIRSPAPPPPLTPPLDASAASPPTSTNSPLHLGRSRSLWSSPRPSEIAAEAS